MLLCATTVVLLVAAAGPRLDEVGASLLAGGSREAGAPRVSVPYFDSDAYVDLELTPLLDLELDYSLSQREGRGPTHVAGLTGNLYPSRLLEVEFSLAASPPGRRDEGTYCLPFSQSVRCVEAVQHVAFLNPGLGVGLTTEPTGDVVGLLEAGVEAILYRLDYDVLEGPASGTHRAFPFQEYRARLEGGVRFLHRVELGAHGSYGLFFGAQQVGTARANALPPTELPLAPTRFEVGPDLSLRLLPGLRADFSAEYAPYIVPCFGHSLAGSLRLTTGRGRLRLFGQLTQQVDVAPTDAATLEHCQQTEPFLDYVSTSARLGFSLGF